MPFITPDDLGPFATIALPKAQALIDDAVARAGRVAPCIADDDLSEKHTAAVKAILRDAILRRNEVGAGAITQQVAGPFAQTVDTRTTTSRVMLWPSEVDELQAICREHNGEPATGAFSVDMVPGRLEIHGETCALRFGASYCDCGANIAGVPIFGPDA